MLKEKNSPVAGMTVTAFDVNAFVAEEKRNRR